MFILVTKLFPRMYNKDSHSLYKFSHTARKKSEIMDDDYSVFVLHKGSNICLLILTVVTVIIIYPYLKFNHDHSKPLTRTPHAPSIGIDLTYNISENTGW